MTLTITAIVAAAALASVAFAVPQQVMAGGHRHHNNSNSNGIRVDQQVNQANQCSGQQPDELQREALANQTQQAVANPQGSSGPGTICLNLGSNSANIGHH